MKTAFALLIALSAPVQEEVVLKRTFESGQKWAHVGQVLVTMDMGQLQVDFDMSEEVLKVLSDGKEADVKRRVSNLKTLFNGNELERGGPMAQSAFEWTSKLDERGVATAAEAAKPGVLQSLLSTALVASVLPGGPVKIGQPFKNEFETMGRKVKLEATLAEIKDGTARIQSTLEWSSPEAGPMGSGKATATNWVEVKTGSPIKIEGTVSGIQGPQGVGLQSLTFQVERKKS